MIIQQLRSSPKMIVCLTALFTVAALLLIASFQAKTVDPRVTIEFNRGLTVKQSSPQRTTIGTTIDGEVARTAERIGEATALALSASLYAASEQIRGRAPRGANDLLSGLAARDLLPPGLALTRVEGNLVSTYSNIWVRYRPEPLGVEVISIGHKPSDGPALIVRIPDELSEKGEAKLYVSVSLGAVRVPAAFSPAAEVIALGWSPEPLRSIR